MAQDDRCGFEIVDDFPFMLRHSKHSDFFFRNLLRRGLCCASKEMMETKFIIKDIRTLRDLGSQRDSSK
jgi:hypothetical protein